MKRINFFKDNRVTTRVKPEIAKMMLIISVVKLIQKVTSKHLAVEYMVFYVIQINFTVKKYSLSVDERQKNEK